VRARVGIEVEAADRLAAADCLLSKLWYALTSIPITATALTINCGTELSTDFSLVRSRDSWSTSSAAFSRASCSAFAVCARPIASRLSIAPCTAPRSTPSWSAMARFYLTRRLQVR
jgi:hypothetical protein